MSTLAELQVIMRKILDEEFPSVAKYVQFERVLENEIGLPYILYFTTKWKRVQTCAAAVLVRRLAHFRERIKKFEARMNDFKANDEQVCDECSHYLDKYKCVSKMIKFCNIDTRNLPTRLQCIHIIAKPFWKNIDKVHWYEGLCHQLRVLPLPIANAIIEHIKK